MELTLPPEADVQPPTSHDEPETETMEAKYTVKRIEDGAYPYGVFDPDGEEVDRFKTISEAKSWAKALKEEAIFEDEGIEVEDITNKIKDALDEMDLKALKSLAKKMGLK